jgi:hypothetical protein
MNMKQASRIAEKEENPQPPMQKYVQNTAPFGVEVDPASLAVSKG